MSKFPDIFLPALGGTAVVLGLSYGVANRTYGSGEIAALKDRVAQVEANASAVSEKASGETARAEALQAQIAEIQEAAKIRVAAGGLSEPAPQHDGRYGLGRVALPQEVAAWDVDVLPDGRGLPKGKGDVWTGEEVFVDRCGSCHGDFAEGVDNWPVLAGGQDTLADKDPVKTVGSYWPHLSTVWDYVHRSMPFGEAGTLSADETYAIVAYILYSNDLVGDDFELNQDNFAAFEMYNANGFVVDDRADAEYAKWRAEPCMENCKEEVEITMRSVFLVDTPEEGGTESVMNTATIEGLPSFTADGPSFIPAAAPQPKEEASATPAVEEAPEADAGAELIAAGEKVFKKCKACHQVGAGAENKTGPHLNGIIGRGFGAEEGFRYSNVFVTAAQEGRVWDEQSFAEFLKKPKSYLKGTKMSFSGLKKDSDIVAVVAYLNSVGG
ncbi:MAG: c-type cytochrome [Marinosulfonomonas sp.]